MENTIITSVDIIKLNIPYKEPFVISPGIIPEATNIVVNIHTSSGLTALMHLVAARNNIVHFDMDSSLMLDSDPVTGGIQYRGNGKWELGDNPGIGAGFNEEYLNSMYKETV